MAGEAPTEICSIHTEAMNQKKVSSWFVKTKTNQALWWLCSVHTASFIAFLRFWLSSSFSFYISFLSFYFFFSFSELHDIKTTFTANLVRSEEGADHVATNAADGVQKHHPHPPAQLGKRERKKKKFNFYLSFVFCLPFKSIFPCWAANIRARCWWQRCTGRPAGGRGGQCPCSGRAADRTGT